MSKVNFHLEQETPDLRADEFAIKFTVENASSKPVKIFALAPQIPTGVKINEAEDSSLLAVKTKHTKLSSELTELANDATRLEDQDLRRKLIDIEKDHLNTAINEIQSNFFRAYFRMFFRGSMAKWAEEKVRKQDALLLKVEDSKDAEAVRSQFLDAQQNPHVKKLFALKLGKLKEVEDTLGGPENSRNAPLAIIEHGSSFCARYVLTFRRRFFNTTRFSFSIEAVYGDDSGVDRLNGSDSLSIEVAPKPIFVSLLAALFSVGGVVLKIGYDTHLDLQRGFAENLVQSRELITAPILAFVLFNVFEFTNLLKQFRRFFDWRTALIIGIACGLFSERILTAIKVLVGGS